MWQKTPVLPDFKTMFGKLWDKNYKLLNDAQENRYIECFAKKKTRRLKH